VIRRKLKK